MDHETIDKAIRHIKRAKKLILEQPIAETPMLELAAGSHLLTAVNILEQRRALADKAPTAKVAENIVSHPFSQP